MPRSTARSTRHPTKPAPKSAASAKSLAKDIEDLKFHEQFTDYAVMVDVPVEALVTALEKKILPIASAWNYRNGIRAMPPSLLPSVLRAKRKATQDANLWSRVDQLFGVEVPAGTKLDPLLADAVTVLAKLRGEKVRLPSRYAAAWKEFLFDAPVSASVPSTPPRPTQKTHKSSAKLGQAESEWNRDRLRAVFNALSGGSISEVLWPVFTENVFDQRTHSPGVLPMLGLGVTPNDLIACCCKTFGPTEYDLATLIRDNKWGKGLMKRVAIPSVHAKEWKRALAAVWPS